MNALTVRQIVIDCLEAKGYTGLFNRDGECGCKFTELASCENLNLDCEAGYVANCSTCKSISKCETTKRYGDGCGFIVARVDCYKGRE